VKTHPSKVQTLRLDRLSALFAAGSNLRLCGWTSQVPAQDPGADH